MPLNELEEEYEPPIWAAFGDLMACLFGLFVLFFVWTVMGQVVLDRDLARERASLAAAHTRLSALESALAGPLASGLITLVDGRIGIRGALLFESNDAGLRREGKRLLEQLAPPLHTFVRSSTTWCSWSAATPTTSRSRATASTRTTGSCRRSER